MDALSHAALFPDATDQTRYVSLGGKPNSRQPALLEAMIAKLPENSEIVAAFDADGAGRTLVEVARAAVRRVANQKERMNLIFQSHLPEQEGEDWNQVLQNLTCQKGNR